MKKLIPLLAILLFVSSIKAQDNQSLVIKKYIITKSTEVNKPIFADVENVNGDVFKDEDLIKFAYLNAYGFRPAAGDDLEWKDLYFLKWKKTTAKSDGSVSIKKSQANYQLAYAVFYLHNEEWADLEMNITSGQMLEVFIDGELKEGKYSWEKPGSEKKLTFNVDLSANNHMIMVKTLYSKKESDQWKFSYTIKKKNASNTYQLKSGLDPYNYMDISHLMNGVDIRSAKLSAVGDYYFIAYKMTTEDGKRHNIVDVKRISDHHTMQLFHGNDAYWLKWAPKGNKLTYVTNIGNKSWIWEYNLENGKRFPLATDLLNLSDYYWSPNGEYIIYSTKGTEKKDDTAIKNIEGISNKWPLYHDRSNLFMLDILSGIKTPLTYGYLSNDIQDISPNGRYILFSQRIFDQDQQLNSKQILFQFDIRSQKIDTIWNQVGNSSVKYSPDGKQLLVTAGPAFFGKLGMNLSRSTVPNRYDLQAYIYTISDKTVKAITKTFNPSIENAYWSRTNPNFIYLRVADKTHVYEYAYNIQDDSFLFMNLDMDVVNSVDFSNINPIMIYYGSSISTPKKAYMANVETGEKIMLDFPEANFFKNVEFGKNEKWDFINDAGVTIEGRLYYPPQFDPTKKYPMIVYYYGGTNPTERSFRGRYPKNLFAANGYLVYVLQPSGATGYGQNFSAEHIDNWDKLVADEIIKGSRMICQTHSFIDSTKVGCIGASYGGYMTMYLITQTDFYSAAISHAGISAIGSYWGEGYWAYQNADEKQNPLFPADKVNTPFLLVHGSSNTNMPTNESRQFYSALTALNKDAELIEVDKDNHHVIDYNTIVLWQQTILAWFDKNLKNQPDWWNHLYPKKK